VAFFTIQTTTPYNLLWVDYGKYFLKSQVLFHSFFTTLDSPCEGDERTPADQEDGKIVMERMTRTRFRSHMLARRDRKNSSKNPSKGLKRKDS
jgi:hypothetical protein